MSDSEEQTTDSYVSGFSDGGLLGMHLGIIKALKADDEIPEDQEKLYGVRIHKDWKQWADVLEAELTKRNIQFDKVPW